MTIVDTGTTVRPVEVQAPADHSISIATVASELSIKESTVHRYLRAGRLARLGGAVSADSVAAYAAARAMNITRTRFQPAKAYTPASPIEAACAAYNAGVEARRAADRTIRPAKKTLQAVGPGSYGPWDVEMVPSGRETPNLEEITRILTGLGMDVPMRPVADTIRVTWVG
ncbi:hypothetical protein [Frankia sp. KB5]|uniref:hypothetical protein n=1 Tax=Frankia sp. KB5 TaxID=683318 RepID=UPI000A0F4DAD|nr:hypothetical protein [Frankia sp. KB5]ORT46978.1 hypothetical protein KBI5_22220 [Frankia sp. KB5]